jgi:hypothetical protein
VKQKIMAGRDIDAATADEVRAAVDHGLRSWQREVITGARFTRFSASATIANGAFTLDGVSLGSERLGPNDGFVWDVRRLRVVGLQGADSASIWINATDPSTFIASTSDGATPAGTGALLRFDRQLILQPGEWLVITGSGLVASTGQVTVTGQAIEVPVSHQWRLIG